MNNLNNEIISTSRLERARGHLWILAFLLLFIYAACIIIVVEPGRWNEVSRLPARVTISILLVSLGILTLLFCGYVITRESTFRRRQGLMLAQSRNSFQNTLLQLETLEKIYKSVVAFYHSHQINDMLDDIARTIAGAFKADYVSIMMRENPDNGFTLNGLKTGGLFGVESADIRTALAKTMESITNYMAGEKDASFLDYPKDYSRFAVSSRQGREIKSTLSVPLILQDKVIGALNVVRTVPADNFTEEERFLVVVAKYISICVEYVYLVKETSQHQMVIAHMEKLAALGELSAGVAHEINNPLTIIRLSTDWLAEKFKADEQSGRKLASIREEINQMAGIIQSLLTFSRKTDETQRAPADLNALIEKTLEPLEHQLTLNNIRIVRMLTGDLPRVNLNFSQIQQVLLNLVNNAHDAMPQGGRITVRTYQGKITEAIRRRRTDIFKTGQRIVVLEVSDSGRGIPEEVKGKLFTPFFTTKEEGKGTGLGLSVSYGIINAHAGDIQVESVAGKGTTFIIRLPAAKHRAGITGKERT